MAYSQQISMLTNDININIYLDIVLITTKATKSELMDIYNPL